MQFNRVNNKDACIPLVISGAGIYTHVSQFHMLVYHGLAFILHEAFFWRFCSVAAHHPDSSPPPFPPSFHCFNNVMGACFYYCVGAHGWVARISQPWEQSSSRCWLPMVEAPGCLRRPTSIFSDAVVNNVFFQKISTPAPMAYSVDCSLGA